MFCADVNKKKVCSDINGIPCGWGQILNWIFWGWLGSGHPHKIFKAFLIRKCASHTILLWMNFINDIIFKRIAPLPSNQYQDPTNICFVMKRLCVPCIHGWSQPQTMKPFYILPKKIRCGEKASLTLSTVI